MAKRNTPKVTRDKPQALGYMPTPHGTTPWHFRHESMEGNGFNGVIRNMWRVSPSAMAIPGLGVVPTYKTPNG